MRHATENNSCDHICGRRDGYDLEDHRSLYRHAHATGPMVRRRMNLRFAAETLVEESTRATVSGDTVLRAIRTCTRINDRGGWYEPPAHVIVSSGGRVNVDNQVTIVQHSSNLLSPEHVQESLQAHVPIQTASTRHQPPPEVEILPALEPSDQIEPAISNRQFARLENQSKNDSKQTSTPSPKSTIFMGTSHPSARHHLRLVLTDCQLVPLTLAEIEWWMFYRARGALNLL
jgi:hypothetical protein